MSTPRWAAWTENYCGTWHLAKDKKKKLEIGMLVVKFPDGKLHPGVVYPNDGIVVAGGWGFQAKEVKGKKRLEVLSQASQGTTEGIHPIVEPTEGEVYEEEEET